jgi:hypothetical protein
MKNMYVKYGNWLDLGTSMIDDVFECFVIHYCVNK